MKKKFFITLTPEFRRWKLFFPPKRNFAHLVVQFRETAGWRDEVGGEMETGPENQVVLAKGNILFIFLLFFNFFSQFVDIFNQGTLTEGEGLVQLTSLLR